MKLYFNIKILLISFNRVWKNQINKKKNKKMKKITKIQNKNNINFIYFKNLLKYNL